MSDLVKVPLGQKGEQGGFSGVSSVRSLRSDVLAADSV